MRLCFALAAIGISAALATVPSHARTRYFLVSNGPAGNDFTIALHDPALIAKARQIVAGKVTDQVAVSGRIVKRAVAYNRPWHFHLQPSSITFITFGTPMCLRYLTTSELEANLAKIGSPDFSPLGYWCPVGSRVTAEKRRP